MAILTHEVSLTADASNSFKKYQESNQSLADFLEKFDFNESMKNLHRHVIPAIFFTLGLSLLPSSDAAPIARAGAACPKKGAVQVVGTKKFTCKTNGKKLVWDKGISVPKTATPVITTAPLPVVTQINFENLESNFSKISYTAWKKSQDKIVGVSNTQIPVEILLGPNSKLNNTKPEFAVSQVARLYSGAVFPKKVILLAFAYADRDWAAAKMNEIVPNAISAWIKDVACPSPSSCIGGGSYHNKADKTALLVIATGVDPNNVDNAFSGTLEAHEYAHSIQQSSADALRPGVSLLQSPWPPNWYWEGLAHFSQHAAIYSDSYDNYMKYRRATAGGIFKNNLLDAKYIEEYFQTKLTAEWGAKYPRWHQYDLGAMLVEILVAINGPDSAMQVFNESVNGVGFESAFQKIYGISFESVLPAISRAIALELKN